MMNQSNVFPVAVDTHCHVDLYQDSGVLFAEAEKHKILVVAVTNAPSVFFHTKNLAKQCRYILPAIGLHPELVHSHWREIEQMMPLLEETPLVGEIGLDYVTSDEGQRAQQRKVFERILEKCATLGGKVLTIHSRRAATDVISAIGTNYNGKTILHWFTGTKKEAERALAAGCFFSINLAMVKAKSSQSLIAHIPLERLLTETDGPFVQSGSSPSTPVNVFGVISALSRLLGHPEEEIREALLRNFQSLSCT